MKRTFESENIGYVEVSQFPANDYLAMVNNYEDINRFIGGKYRELMKQQEPD